MASDKHWLAVLVDDVIVNPGGMQENHVDFWNKTTEMCAYMEY